MSDAVGEDPLLLANARVGSVLCGKWRLDRVLGVGGFASVFAASNRTKKRVALKMLHLELSQNAQVRARFLREALAANTVNHPGAVSVFDEPTVDAQQAPSAHDEAAYEPTVRARRVEDSALGPRGTVRTSMPQDPDEDDDRAATALWKPAPKAKPETLDAPAMARFKATLPFVRAPAPPAPRRRPIGRIVIIVRAVAIVLGLAAWAIHRAAMTG